MTDLKDYQAQVNEILSKLPSNPYVIDVIDKAIKISAEKSPKDEFEEKLAIATKMVGYTSKTSPANFYKYHLIAAPLLAGLNPDDYKELDTASGIVTNSAAQLTRFFEETSVKKKWEILVSIAKQDKELYLVAVVALHLFAEAIIAKEEPDVKDILLLTVIGYLELCIRKGKIETTTEMYPYVNAFSATMINKAKF